MRPIERRIVHLALQDDADVTTESRGDGFYKRVAIMLRERAEQSRRRSRDASTLDTIVAPATPLGRSALAIVRIDGPRSGAILRRSAARTPGCARRHATHNSVMNGELLDECIAIRYAAPHSFTGNDLVELTLHGNPLLVERVIAAAIGARRADRGAGRVHRARGAERQARSGAGGVDRRSDQRAHRAPGEALARESATGC